MRSNTTTPTADKLRRASGRSAGEPDENRPSSARGTRARLSGRSVRRRRCQFPVAADHAVDVAVTPLAIPETSAADTPFALQPDALKCSLFRDVVDGRTGPDAVARGRREEIVDEQTLRRGACAAPAVLGVNQSAELPHARPWTIVLAPIDPPQKRVGIVCEAIEAHQINLLKWAQANCEFFHKLDSPTSRTEPHATVDRDRGLCAQTTILHIVTLHADEN